MAQAFLTPKREHVKVFRYSFPETTPIFFSRLKGDFRVFLGVAETIVSSLLCCGVGIVQCLFNLLYYVIGVRNTKKPPDFIHVRSL